MKDWTPASFFDWIVPELRALKRRYRLDNWDIQVRIAPDNELSPKNAAEVAIREEYRSATIYLAESLARRGDKALLLNVVDHELQHIFLHPLDALRSLVLDALPDNLKDVIGNEFGRTNERIRASLERLIADLSPLPDEELDESELQPRPLAS